MRDQNRALDFYTEKLGFTIITDQPFDEKQRWIELRIPKAETRVVLFTPDGDEKRIGSFMNMSYVCDDIDKTYAELASVFNPAQLIELVMTVGQYTMVSMFLNSASVQLEPGIVGVPR